MAHIKSRSKILDLSTDDLCNLLKDHGIGDCCEAIRVKNIKGESFLYLTEGQVYLWYNLLKKPQLKKLMQIVTLANENPDQFLSKPEVRSENIQQTMRNKPKPQIDNFYSPASFQLPSPRPKLSPSRFEDTINLTEQVLPSRFVQNVEQHFDDFDSSDEEPNVEFSITFEDLNLPTPPPVMNPTVQQNNFQRQEGQLSNIFRHISPYSSVTNIDPKIRPLPTSPTTDNTPSYQLATWYFDVDRSEATKRLINKPNGCFLIRPSSKSEYVCTLTMVYMGNIYNLGIARNDMNLLRIGQDSVGKKLFTTVEELVEYYVNNEISLQYLNEDIYVRLRTLNT